MRFTQALLFIFFAVTSIHAQKSAPSVVLPFTTEETTETVTLKISHRVEWNRKSGEYKWDKLEAEMPGHFTVSLEPGRWNPREDKPQKAEVKMKVRDGVAGAEAIRRTDASWAISTSVKLDPREFVWTDPEIKLHGLTVDGDVSLDSLLTSGPLQMVQAMKMRSVGIETIEAGSYRVDGVRLSGDWDRPTWNVEKLEAGVFGGRIELAGSGRWGTNETPAVSVTLKGESLDFHELLKAFNVPRAEQVRGRVSGRMRIESVGRDWKIMALDVGGDEGTVFLDRALIAEIISYSLATPVTNPKVREVLETLEAGLTQSYGNQPLVPMREMRIQGNLEPGILHLWLPLRNDVVNILLEPKIEREVVWESWDYLVKAGAENVKGMKMDAETERVNDPPADPQKENQR